MAFLHEVVLLTLDHDSIKIPSFYLYSLPPINKGRHSMSCVIFFHYTQFRFLFLANSKEMGGGSLFTFGGRSKTSNWRQCFFSFYFEDSIFELLNARLMIFVWEMRTIQFDHSLSVGSGVPRGPGKGATAPFFRRPFVETFLREKWLLVIIIFLPRNR